MGVDPPALVVGRAPPELGQGRRLGHVEEVVEAKLTKFREETLTMIKLMFREFAGEIKQEMAPAARPPPSPAPLAGAGFDGAVMQTPDGRSVGAASVPRVAAARPGPRATIPSSAPGSLPSTAGLRSSALNATTVTSGFDYGGSTDVSVPAGFGAMTPRGGVGSPDAARMIGIFTDTPKQQLIGDYKDDYQLTEGRLSEEVEFQLTSGGDTGSNTYLRT